MAGPLFTLRMLAVLDVGNVVAGLKMMAGQSQVTGSAINAGVGAAAIAVAGGMFKATQAAIEWEDGFAGVKRTVDDAGMSAEESGAMFSELEADLRGVAKAVPLTHAELASMAQTAGALGVEAEDIAEFSKVAGTISKLSDDLSPQDVAYNMGKIRTIFGMASEDFENFGSAVVQLGVDGASTEGEILSMAQYGSGAMALLGAGVEDSLAFAAAFSNVGVKAEAGGSGIQKMFLNAGMAVSEGNKHLARFAALTGTTEAGFASMFKSDPADAIRQVVAGLAKMEDPLSGLRSVGINQARWTRGWASVIKAVQNTNKADGDLNHTMALSGKAMEEGTALGEMAETRWDTLSKQIDILMNNFYDLGITIGMTVVPIIRSVVDFMIPLVDGFNMLLQSVPGLTAVLGPLVAVLSSIVAIRFGAHLLTMLLPMGPLGNMLATSWTGIINTGVLAPITTRLKTLPGIMSAAIRTGLAGPAAVAAANAAGTGIASTILGSFVARIKANPMKSLLGGGLIGLGQFMEAGLTGNQMVDRVGGAMMTIAGGFALGGPIGGAAAAIYEGVMAVVNMSKEVEKLTADVDAMGDAWVTEATTEELEKSLADLKSVPGDLEGIVKDVYNASDITQGTIFSGIFGNVAETNERQIAKIEAELALRAKGMGSNVVEKADATAEEIRAAMEEIDGGLAEGGEAVVRTIFDIGNDLQSAWQLVEKKIKPPKNISLDDRLMKMWRAIRQARTEMQKSVKADDPVNAAFWRQRLRDLRTGMAVMKHESAAALAGAAAKWEEHRARIKARQDAVVKGTKDMAAGVGAGMTDAGQAVITGGLTIATALDNIDLTASGAGVVQSLASGMLSEIGTVRAASAAAAAAAAGPLKFSSPPAYGPLSTIRTWGPHMVDEWLKPIEGRLGRVRAMGSALGMAIVPRGQWQPAYAGAGVGRGLGGRRGRGRGRGDNYQIGVLVADDGGLDELDKRIERRRKMRGRGPMRYRDTD